jgi:guanylate kinase
MPWDRNAKSLWLCFFVVLVAGCAAGASVERFFGAALIAFWIRYACTCRSIKRVILVGRACAGKDYVRNKLYENGHTVDVGVTTRDKRPNEKDAYTYDFVSFDRFIEMVKDGEMYEHVKFGTNYYGTTMKSWSISDVFIMSPKGITDNVTPEDRKTSYVIYLDPPECVLQQRLESRGDSRDRMKARMAADDADFMNFTDYDYRITDPIFNVDHLCHDIAEMLRVN